MIWYLVALPFWLVAAFAAFIAVYGTVLCLRTDNTVEDVKLTLWGFIAWLLIASASLAIALKVSGL